jgi:hypothetical protein
MKKIRKKHKNRPKLPLPQNNNRQNKTIKQFASRTKNKNPKHSKKPVADLTNNIEFSKCNNE